MLAHPLPAALSADRLREESGFRREYDGHVWLRSMDGNWLEVRTDAKMPGTVLLRDKDGYVYFITYPGAQQVRRVQRAAFAGHELWLRTCGPALLCLQEPMICCCQHHVCRSPAAPSLADIYGAGYNVHHCVLCRST